MDLKDVQKTIEEEKVLNVKRVKDLRIMLNVLVLRSLPITLSSIVSSFSLGEMTHLLTLDICLMFSLLRIKGKNQIQFLYLYSIFHGTILELQFSPPRRISQIESVITSLVYGRMPY